MHVCVQRSLYNRAPSDTSTLELPPRFILFVAINLTRLLVTSVIAAVMHDILKIISRFVLFSMRRKLCELALSSSIFKLSYIKLSVCIHRAEIGCDLVPASDAYQKTFIINVKFCFNAIIYIFTINACLKLKFHEIVDRKYCIKNTTIVVSIILGFININYSYF